MTHGEAIKIVREHLEKVSDRRVLEALQLLLDRRGGTDAPVIHTDRKTR